MYEDEPHKTVPDAFLNRSDMIEVEVIYEDEHLRIIGGLTKKRKGRPVIFWLANEPDSFTQEPVWKLQGNTTIGLWFAEKVTRTQLRNESLKGLAKEWVGVVGASTAIQGFLEAHR
jgi:hypothetical protein